jgi:hypothetical protein
MFDHKVRIEKGRCVECGAHMLDGYRCDEMFHYPLAWEHNDPELYALHFWLVSCYIIQHPSIYTQEAYDHLIDLFKRAYDEKWNTEMIVQQNREKLKEIPLVVNPVKEIEIPDVRKEWSSTIADIYLDGEEKAIESIKYWRDCVRKEMDVE